LAGDFHLVNGSRILQQGNTDTESAKDFCGNRRVGKPDIGPIEYQSAQACLAGRANP
jgi:hypothetical protein